MVCGFIHIESSSKLSQSPSWEGWFTLLWMCEGVVTMKGTEVSDIGSVGGILFYFLKNTCVYVFVCAPVDKCHGLCV